MKNLSLLIFLFILMLLDERRTFDSILINFIEYCKLGEYCQLIL
mgnify:CR=1 FL=1